MGENKPGFEYISKKKWEKLWAKAKEEPKTMAWHAVIFADTRVTQKRHIVYTFTNNFDQRSQNAKLDWQVDYKDQFDFCTEEECTEPEQTATCEAVADNPLPPCAWRWAGSSRVPADGINTALCAPKDQSVSQEKCEVPKAGKAPPPPPPATEEDKEDGDEECKDKKSCGKEKEKGSWWAMAMNTVKSVATSGSMGGFGF